VVRAYTQFARDTGVRLTYFVNGVYRSWTDHVELLRPLVDDGQIQLANHTWSHPDLTRLPLTDVAEEFRAQPRIPVEHLRSRRAPVLPAAVRRAQRACRQAGR
jgi:peptidoglycan/xylan/chitin deacetylase (PgdA/CDA1 family)